MVHTALATAGLGLTTKGFAQEGGAEELPGTLEGQVEPDSSEDAQPEEEAEASSDEEANLEGTEDVEGAALEDPYAEVCLCACELAREDSSTPLLLLSGSAAALSLFRCRTIEK